MVLPSITNMFLDNGFLVLSVMLILCILVPWAILIVAFITFIVLIIRLKVLKVIKEAMKLNLISRSPVASILGSSISGLPSIRAYDKTTHFQTQFEGCVDVNGKAFMTFHLISRALGYYLDQTSIFFVVSFTFLCFAVRNDDNPLVLALAIQLINSVVGIIQFVVRISADIENYLNAISRCLEYSRLPTEPALRA